MSQEPTAAELAMLQGNNAAAVKQAGEDVPHELVRDPIYAMIYVGGLAVYGLLIAVFLL
jgi:hypothetical protein